MFAPSVYSLEMGSYGLWDIGVNSFFPLELGAIGVANPLPVSNSGPEPVITGSFSFFDAGISGLHVSFF